MTVSREEFERNLAESGLFAEDALRAMLAAVPGPAEVGDGDAIARHLVAHGHLTAFQAEAVRQRRFELLCVGNYVVLDHLGAGGMGTVYKARHRKMKRAVALKVLTHEGVGRSFARRFEREIETIAQLSHPNIVMAFDAAEAQVGSYLVMEYVDGRDLGAEVKQGGPLAVAEAVEATIDAARGLDYAHSRGFVHRDVKPANLLRDSRGRTKVADLGLARLEAPEVDSDAASASAVTQAGSVLGTADYMAPEQALDPSNVGYRSDIYALGCTLFYLLAGRPPYAAGSLIGLLLKHRDTVVPSLKEGRPEVPDELDAIFRRMAAKEPAGRYASMAEVIAALEGVRPLVAGLVDRPGPGAGSVDPATLSTTVSVDTIRHTDPPEMTVADDSSPGSGDVVDASTASRLAGLVVVIVEPSRSQAGITRRYLLDLGIDRVSRAESGGEAVGLVHRAGAHVLLSAMHLPDMTGADLARALRADPACAGVGFVLTSSESEHERAGGYRAGPGMALLHKPFDLRALAHALALATGRGADEILPALG